MKWLFILFIVVPTSELAVLLYAGSKIGVFPTIAIILLTAAAGAWLAKSQGLMAWRELQRRAAAGEPPGEAAVDGLFILIGGLFLLFPGFITDALGLLLLLPPTRRAFRPVLYRQLRKKMKNGSMVIIRR
ncbi:FxsA family protein [Bhargavaea cecembensis]|uniref:FxsA family protein n=1 Tax=Bhargavaea cecembensis TaxID=394098 RepID=UPI00058B118A|nr:FxsA family protein [Bhargavaea cecembensis]